MPADLGEGLAEKSGNRLDLIWSPLRSASK
jgi:hypothetical protein